MSEKRGFSSKIGLIFTLIATSVGTGNIWRFPRVAAANGGGAFIIAYILIMLLIVIPVMIGEHVLGRCSRHAAPGAYRSFAGRRSTWIGSAITCVSVIANAYYAVVVAWVLYYLGLSVTRRYFGEDKAMVFDRVSNGNVITVILFLVILISSAYIAYRGIKFMEKLNRVFIPLLFICLLIIDVRTVTLPGVSSGLNFLYHLDVSQFGNLTMWLEALSQAVWSTTVGSGVLIAVTVFSEKKSDIALTSTINGLGDMFAAMLAGLAVVPAVFAFNSADEALAICRSGNNGLAFISMTSTFESMPGGYIIAILFFLSLLIAGFSSEVSQQLIVTLPLVDSGVSKKKASIIMTAVMAIIGLPCAWNINILSNEDFVVGMLMTLGVACSCYALARFGLRKIRTKFINNPYSALNLGKWWEVSVLIIAPAAVIIIFLVNMIPIMTGGGSWWNPFELFSMGTFLVQGGIIVLVCIVFNSRIAGSIKHEYFDGETIPEVPDNEYSM